MAHELYGYEYKNGKHIKGISHGGYIRRVYPKGSVFLQKYNDVKTICISDKDGSWHSDSGPPWGQSEYFRNVPANKSKKIPTCFIVTIFVVLSVLIYSACRTR